MNIRHDSISLKNAHNFSGRSTLFAEDPFRLMVDTVVDYAIFMLDPQGNVATWNAGARHIKGYEANEIIGSHFSIFYAQEALSRCVPEHMLEMAAKVGRFEDEGYRVRKDGSLFWANVILTALHDADGELIGFGKVTRDLTERKNAEAALFKVEQRFHLMVDAVVDYGLFMMGPSGIITSWNMGAERLHGYKAEEIIARHFSIFYTPEARKTGWPELELTIAAKQGHCEDEGWRIRKDGSQIWTSVSITALRDTDNNLIGFAKVTRDLTERRLAAELTIKAYEQVNAVLECTSDSVIAVSREWIVLYANSKSVAMLPGLEIGESYWTCSPEILGTPVERYLRSAMEERKEQNFENFYVADQDWYRVSVFPSKEGISIFFGDITEAKKLQEQLALEQLLREKRIEALSHIAGGLAHEISNPLAIMHARTSDLQQIAGESNVVESAEVIKACESIVRTSDRAMRILRGLKGFGRDADNDPMELSSIDEIIDQCVELQEARFSRHNVHLQIDLQTDIPQLYCRSTQIEQIITNLLNNAFDAIIQSGAKNGWVSITAIRCHQDVFVDVTDSGPGIEDHFKPHLMEPFFTTKEVGVGMGIGLSLSRAIAQAHRGSLTLMSNTKNTCFRLVLPLYAKELRSNSIQ